MKHPKDFSLVIAPGGSHMRGSVGVKHIVCGVFIVLIALFFTIPSAAGF